MLNRAPADFYANKLGFTVAFTDGDPPTFAGVNLDRVQIFLSKGAPAPQGCSVYFVVSNCSNRRASWPPSLSFGRSLKKAPAIAWT